MPRDDVGPDEQALRVPPHSLEAEQGLLGSLLLDNDVLGLVGDLVDAPSFYTVAHRQIFQALADLLKQRLPADIVTVFEFLERASVPADTYGGLAYLNSLMQAAPTARNARRYAELVADLAADRALLAGIAEMEAIGWRSSEPLADRMEMIASILARVEQQRKGPGRRVPVLKLDALREASAAVRWTVKHVVPADSVGMLFGGTGTFKSFIALDLALHVAHGQPWMGRQTVKGQVLYIAAEGGAGLWGRIDAWHRVRNMQWQAAPLFVVPQAVDLSVDAWRVVDAAQSIGANPALVVVDTLSQTYSGEENSANEMAAYLREIGLRFRALWGCAVVLVHHTGHQATERPRGTSAIRANLDFLLGVFRDETEMLATMTAVKQKDGELMKDAVFSLGSVALGNDADGDLVTSLSAWHLSSQEHIDRAREKEAESGRMGRQHQFLKLLDTCTEERSLRRAFNELLEGIDAESKRKAYQRTKAAAIKAGHMDVVDGVVIDRRKGKQ